MSNFFNFQTAEEALNNFDDFLLSLFDDDIILEADVVASACNGLPRLEILLNQNLIFNEEVPIGAQSYKIKIPCSPKQNVLSLALTNKNSSDCIVINDVIVQDKWIKFSKLAINGLDLMSDYTLFVKLFDYYQGGKSITPMMGFWSNSMLSLTFESPFALWYAANAKKNVPNEIAGRVAPADQIQSLEKRIKEILTKLHV